MNGNTFFVVVLCGLLSCGASIFGQSAIIPVLTNTATISGTTYRCEEMTQSVNNLRHLGKDQALKVLKSDIDQNTLHDVEIMCICRLLFQNTNGWKPIAGADMYRAMVHTNVLDSFPLFPMALSEGVPFFIFRGYDIGGRLGESASEDLQLCEGFAMIPADLPEFNYQKAAIKLLQSEPFLKLYKIPDYAESDYTVDLMCEIIWQTDIIPKKQVNP